MSPLIRTITAAEPEVRDLALERLVGEASLPDMLEECRALEEFRRRRENLYERVRALFFLAALHRYHIPPRLPADAAGRVPHAGHAHLLERRFEEAVDAFADTLRRDGPSEAICSALAAAYRGLASTLR